MPWIPERLQPFIFGGIASVTAEYITFPIDTSKTRLQVQGQRIEPNFTQIRYRGMIHAITRIRAEEGFWALYNGITPAILRQASYGTIKIGCYYTFKRLLFPDPEKETLFSNVICAILAGVISSSIANPTDVLKIRMQAQSGANGGNSLRIVCNSFINIYQKEGAKGLYRGVIPTAGRAAIVVGVELPAYDWCKKKIMLYSHLGDRVTTHFLASAIAGLAGAIASNPVDVVKTRMMNQRNLRQSSVSGQNQKIYKNMVDCLVQTYRTEGFFALYKGFIPNWMRLGPWNVIFFITLEQLKQKLGEL